MFLGGDVIVIGVLVVVVGGECFLLFVHLIFEACVDEGGLGIST